MSVCEDDSDLIPVTVEVCQAPTSTAHPSAIEEHVRGVLSHRSISYSVGPLHLPEDDEFLTKHVESVCLTDTFDSRASPGSRLLFWQIRLNIQVFQLYEEGGLEGDEGEDSTSSYREWQLPGREFHTLWDSLVYESDVKQRLLQYAETALLFSERGVNPNLVSFNRTVLLHGPPGTGKTSLCKALAQKLAIRFSSRYQAQLVEVHAHSIFSKWFSESGKLVAKLFGKIMELVEEEGCLVFVLIDEVESLTAARRAAVAGSEPADAIRAVNAVLTHLDSLKHHANVMVLTTSNITEAIDLAFVDRADIKAYIGPPGLEPRYDILRSCLLELQRVGIVNPASPSPVAYADLPSESVPMLSQTMDEDPSGKEEALGKMRVGLALLGAARRCEGLSGRALRKLLFLAHAAAPSPRTVPSAEQCVELLSQAIERELAERSLLASRT